MKKLAITFATASLLSLVAQANEVNRFVDRLGVYAAATYTKPSNNGLSIGDMQTIFPFPSSDNFTRAAFIEPDFEWDYFVGFTYHFPVSQTRLFVDYDNFSDSQDRNVNGLRNIGYEPPPVDETESESTTYENANVHERMQEWRVGLRHFVHFSPSFFIDLSGFIEFARVSRTLNEFNTQFDTDIEEDNAGTAFRSTGNRFNGWGPGVGVKMVGLPFRRCQNISLFAGANTVLFYGTNRFNTYLFDEDTLELSYNPENSKSVVPQIDIDFGIDYRYPLVVSGRPIRAGVTLGARYMNMINVFKNGNTYFNPSFSSNAANLGYPNDWGRVGPYIEFRVGGPHA